jgi:hypothetical protein
MAHMFWQTRKNPVFRAGFLGIGAMIIILSGIGLGFSSPLSASCGTTCLAGNLAMSLGGLLLFFALLNYSQAGNGVWVGAVSIVLAIILIAFDSLGGAGSRPLLIGSVFALVGGIFSLIASVW